MLCCGASHNIFVCVFVLFVDFTKIYEIYAYIAVFILILTFVYFYVILVMFRHLFLVRSLIIRLLTD